MSRIVISGATIPKCCDRCWALDESGDYPICRITGEQRGYNFNIFEKRMPKCPLIDLDAGHWNEELVYYDFDGDPIYSFFCSQCGRGSAYKYDVCPHCGVTMEKD